MKKAFIAGKHGKILYPLTLALGKPVIKILQNITEINPEPALIEKLKSSKDKRLLVIANHPSTAEPPLTTYLGEIAGYPFYFLASRQVFEWEHGLIGQFIQRLGAYSVIAGIPDKDSIEFTKSILAKPNGKLVIYPEGEPTSGENDTLMPFQPGVSQLSFWAMDKIMKEDANGDIEILPIFFRYAFLADEAKLHKKWGSRLKKLEKKLSITPRHDGLVRRTLTIARILLEQLEAKNHIVPEKQDYNYRIGRVRHALLNAVADKLGLPPLPNDMNAILKFRKVFSRIELYMIGHIDPKWPKLSKQEIDWCFKASVRAFDYIIMHRDHLLNNPTYEKIDEWLTRFESFVLRKKPRALGGVPSVLPRKAWILMGTPFSLKEYYTKDRKKRREATAHLTTRLREELTELLEKTSSYTHPYPLQEGELDNLI
ncbi:MAG: hypothetical protein D6767_08625 [Candidatus Hydrogenedentota bacterium]|nr:MAG: hypothetical protein D6767_08625 [Candidatus Hydrogenedentota bacterium]